MSVWREARKTLQMFPLFLLAGCGAEIILGPLACAALCSDDGDDAVVTLTIGITSPEEFTAYEDEAVTIGFALATNPDGAFITVQVGAASVQTELGTGELTGSVTLTPASDSGLIFAVATAVSFADPLVTSQARRGIQWAAPWVATIDDCGVPGCAALAADATLSGVERLAARPTWDATRLAGVELTIDGTPPDDLDEVSLDYAFDAEAFDDRAVSLEMVAVRDDGARATVARGIDVANCPRARPNAQYHLAAYTTDGRLVGAGEEGVVTHDLRTGAATTTLPLVGATPVALAIDESLERAYFGVIDGGGAYRIDVTNTDASTPDTPMTTSVAGIRAITLGPDGYLYWTEGARFGAATGQILRYTQGLIGGPTLVNTTALPGADGLVFDADGTLLVAAGADVVRLTLAAGVETGRATVVTRAGARLTLIARDDAGDLYVTDAANGELLRYTGAAGTPAVLYTQPDWAVGGAHEPWSMSFVEYPPRCHGLLVTRPGLDDARRMVDVGAVRGTP